MSGSKTPCEQLLWYLIPTIRKEIAKSLIERHGLTQKDVASLLGITSAAVSQYLSKKRGSFVEISDKEILKEIDISADRILSDSKNLVFEICRICNLIRNNKNIKIDYRCYG
jgi:hypothetical protein